MKKRIILLVSIVIVIITCFTFSASAEIWEDYEYTLLGDGTVEIKKYNGNAEKLVIPSEINGISVTSIGYSAFSGCKNLSNIVLPETLETIGNYAFRLCTALTEFELPDSVIKIGWGTFSECNALVNVVLSDSLEELPDYVFNYCKSLEKIEIPQSVSKVGSYAFGSCSALERVTFPNELKYLGESAFYGCNSLESVKLPDGITDIKSDTFEKCTNLKSVYIPDTVVNVGYNAFASCENITNINIPDSVKYIDSYAFSGCKRLEKIEIGVGLEKTGLSIFIDCNALTEIKVDEKNSCFSSDEYGVLFDKEKTELIKYPPGCNLTSYVIPESVKSIHTNAFSYCENLLTVKLSDNIEKIEESAFDSSVIYNNKDNWKDGVLYIDNCIIKADSDISICNIKQGTVVVADKAFFGCKGITDISIPDSVKYIGVSSFGTCTAATQLNIGKGVKSIDRYAFQNCNKIKTVLIPDTVEFLGKGAFADCSGLRKIVIGEGIETIKYETFEDCSSLVDVTLSESIKTIDDYAFADCTKLYKIDLPEGLKTIGKGAFLGCINLNKITFPSKVESIGDGAFAFCIDLTSVTIPITDRPMSIGVEAFFFCDSLEDVNIPYTVQSIGDYAFGYSLNDQLKYKRKSFFTITGHDDTAALKYASKHGFSKNRIHYDEIKVLEEPTCVKSGKKSFLCTYCGYEQILNMLPKEHNCSTEVQKASLSKNGRVLKKCLNCDFTETTTVYSPKTITLSATSYTYDGKNKTPTVTVKDANGKKLVKNTDYKLSVASSRKGIGRYTVKVTFIGNYEGTKNLYFYIKPGKPSSVKAASQTTSSVKLSWSKVAGAAGYTVYRYSPSKKAYVKAGTTEGTSLTVKKLNAGTKYTFKVVAYGKTSAGKVYNSDSYTLLKTATKTKTPELTKVTTTKGKATLTHTDVSGETGYTVYYSTKKDSGFKKYDNFKANTKTAAVSGLTSGKTYYFKVRAYIKTDSGYVYSAWSGIKGIKVK